MQLEHKHREQWFHEFVSSVGGDLLRFLRSRLGHGDHAQDLAQEVYLRVLRMEDVSLIRNPRSFVIHLAAHAAYEWRMLARNRLRHSDEYLQELIAHDGDPAESLERDDRIARLSRVLETLSPKCRAVILMHRRDGMTYDEIAERMDLSVGMVKKYLSRGLAACHREMGSHAEGA
jgi:RNA polymerase sigma factor (sigma-70 family)